jgi:hypothetical protein
MDVEAPYQQGRIPGGGSFKADVRVAKIIPGWLQDLGCQTGIVGLNHPEVGFPNTGVFGAGISGTGVFGTGVLGAIQVQG